MQKRRVTVVDIIVKAPSKWAFSRMFNANQASIMPQVVAYWCEQLGHDVEFLSYTGPENLMDELPHSADVVFFGAFSQSAQLCYALSNLMRSRGAVTVLGGPHARCYPEDAQKYFDYVLGFTDREIIRDVMEDCAPHRPLGLSLSRQGQPAEIPGVRERWKYAEKVLDKSKFIKIVPMIGSLGCPYTCSFCIDSVVPYQPLDFDAIKEDLRFLRTKFERPRVGWHDPNFGVRFDDYMNLIEQAVPPDSIDFFAESSLSLMTEPKLRRLKQNGFKAVLPGIESWFDMGNKSKTGAKSGMEKVEQISDHVNTILEYIPYIQTNFVLGLDVDEGPGPFELTKRFIDLAPGAFPGMSSLTAFGRATPLNLEYQKAGRVLAFPLHFLNLAHVMNVRPKNYSWTEYYTRLHDLQSHAFSWRAMMRRYKASKGNSKWIPWVNVLRAMSSEGTGRIRHYAALLKLLEEDREVRDFWEQETDKLPTFLTEWIKRDLGPLWEWLPPGALSHDPYAYLKSQPVQAPVVEAVA